jgi:flagellar biosynthesis activator protein FlaF
VNSTALARAAYGAGPASLRSGRSNEHQIFADVTARLSAALSAGPLGFGAMAAALHDNRKLWSRLAADVADDGNGLPRSLRAQIFYLAEFTDHHSGRVLQGQGTAEALIDINLAIMRGLSGQTVSNKAVQ